MGLSVVLFLIQVLALKAVLSYPVRDYIIAYIPVEELALLNSLNIEAYPITSGDLDFIDDCDSGPVIYIDDTTYYERPLRQAMRPIQGYPPFSMYFPGPYYQPAYTVTFLPPVFLPRPIPPCLPMPLSSQPMSFSSQTLSFSSQPISLSSQPISLSSQPELPILPMNQCDVFENAEEIVLPVDFETVTDTESVPVAGTVAFNGKVPVAGKINIYAKCF